MKNFLHKHLHYYVTFAIMQVAGFAVLLALSGHKDLQIAVIIISTFAYTFWAILHHYQEHSLTVKIVLEYVMFGIFGVTVALFYFK